MRTLKVTLAIVIVVSLALSMASCGIAAELAAEKAEEKRVNPLGVTGGRDYIVKAADGSGQVKLYVSHNFADHVAVTVPDGTEFEAKSAPRTKADNRVEVEYEGQTYAIDLKDFSKETDASAAAAAASRKEAKNFVRMKRLKSLLSLALIIGGFIGVRKWNRIRSLRTYTAYYAHKRRQFPWLEEWLKKHGNTIALRAKEGAGTSTLYTVLIFLVFAGLGYFIFGGFFFPSKSSIVGLFIFMAIGLALGELLARKRAKNPGTADDQDGLTLECPSCTCPHSWVLVQEENTIEGSTTSTETTTRSGYGRGDFFDSALEGFKKDGTTTRVTTTYYGTSIRDFKCLNCDHTEHNEYNMKWGESRVPKEGVTKFSPPKSAWEEKS